MASDARSELRVEEYPGLVPDCPHCNSPLTGVRARELVGTPSAPFGFGKRYVYACPSCNKLLGVTHRKGFWMG